MITAASVAAGVALARGLWALGQDIADAAVKRRPNGWLARRRRGKACTKCGAKK